MDSNNNNRIQDNSRVNSPSVTNNFKPHIEILVPPGSPPPQVKVDGEEEKAKKDGGGS